MVIVDQLVPRVGDKRDAVVGDVQEYDTSPELRLELVAWKAGLTPDSFKLAQTFLPERTRNLANRYLDLRDEGRLAKPLRDLAR